MIFGQSNDTCYNIYKYQYFVRKSNNNILIAGEELRVPSNSPSIKFEAKL